jgi:hypothetical protein
MIFFSIHLLIMTVTAEWLELPCALILLMVVAPSLLANTVRNDWIGVTICLVIACYLLQEHKSQWHIKHGWYNPSVGLSRLGTGT